MNVIEFTVENEFDFSTAIDKLNSSNEVDAVFLGRGLENTIICFAGRGEHFGTYYKWKNFHGNMLLIRDPNFLWYLGDESSFEKLGAVVKNNIKKITSYLSSGANILVGQSSGGYAALLYSKYIANSLVFAFSPQTFARNRSEHYGVYYDSNIKLPLLNDIFDLKNHFADGEDFCRHRFLFVPSLELNNYKDYFWGDLLFAGYLLSYPKVSVVVKDIHSHSLMERVDGGRFTSFILANINSADYSKLAKSLADSGCWKH